MTPIVQFGEVVRPRPQPRAVGTKERPQTDWELEKVWLIAAERAVAEIRFLGSPKGQAFLARRRGISLLPHLRLSAEDLQEIAKREERPLNRAERRQRKRYASA